MDGKTHADRCKHEPPRYKMASLGTVDYCKCGAQRFVLRYSGNTGSQKTSHKRRWDKW